MAEIIENIEIEYVNYCARSCNSISFVLWHND